MEATLSLRVRQVCATASRLQSIVCERKREDKWTFRKQELKRKRCGVRARKQHVFLSKRPSIDPIIVKTGGWDTVEVIFLAIKHVSLLF